MKHAGPFQTPLLFVTSCGESAGGWNGPSSFVDSVLSLHAFLVFAKERSTAEAKEETIASSDAIYPHNENDHLQVDFVPHNPSHLENMTMQVIRSILACLAMAANLVVYVLP